MPLYFAYGANLDRAGMAQRCPSASPLGTAWIENVRFIVMADGYATIVPEAASVVHGLLWEIAAADFEALDSFEAVETGLYRRCLLPIRRGSERVDATVYLAASTVVGVAQPGYMEAVVAAAAACGLPIHYRAELTRWLVAA